MCFENFRSPTQDPRHVPPQLPEPRNDISFFRALLNAWRSFSVQGNLISLAAKKLKTSIDRNARQNHHCAIFARVSRKVRIDFAWVIIGIVHVPCPTSSREGVEEAAWLYVRQIVFLTMAALQYQRVKIAVQSQLVGNIGNRSNVVCLVTKSAVGILSKQIRVCKSCGISLDLNLCAHLS